MVHVLKTYPHFFNRVKSGQKTFEVRRHDRDFQVGDTLQLEYFENEPRSIVDVQPLSPEVVNVEVTYLLKGGQFGIDKDYCVMGIKLIE